MQTVAITTSSTLPPPQNLPLSTPAASVSTPAAPDVNVREARLPNLGQHSLITPETRGINPVTPNRSNSLVAHFKPSDQQIFLAQNDHLNRSMGKLLGAQPNLQTFIQSKIAQAFPGIQPIHVEGLSFNRYKETEGTRTLISSEPIMKALSTMIREQLANPEKRFVDEPDVTTDFVHRPNAQSSAQVANASMPLHAIAREIVTQFPKALQDYWTQKVGGSASPQNELLTLHRQSLSNQAALRVTDGTLSPQGKQLIDTALRYPTLEERETAFADGARPGVYPITVDDGTEQGAMLPGAFMITQRDGSSATPPTWPAGGREIAMNDQHGPVVLYTPGEGFEAFQTPAQLRQALALRIDKAREAANLLQQSLPLKLSNPESPLEGEGLMLSAKPLASDVLAQSMSLLLVQQDAQVRAQVQRTLANADLNDSQAQATIDQSADISHLFDNSNAMLVRNEKLAEKQQPAWLKNLSQAQQAIFTHLEEVEQKSAAALAPHLEKIPSLPAFARNRMNEAIKRQYPNADIDADQLNVQIHTQSRTHTGRAGYPQERQKSTRHSSLTDFALKNPTQWEAAKSGQYSETTLSLPLLDTQKRPIRDSQGNPVVLNTEQLKSLVNNADVGGEYTQLLEQNMAPDATTGDAAALRDAWKASQGARMTQEAFLAQLNPDAFQSIADVDKTSKRGLQWAMAVIDHPDPATRPQVDGKDIAAHSVLHNGLPAQGVFMIGNAHDASVVLYTPDAPDGQAFRELPNHQAIGTLLDKPEWKVYIAQRKSPVDKDHNQEFFNTLTRQSSSPRPDPFKTLELMIKGIATLGATVTTAPIPGNTFDALYKQQVRWVIDKADAQSTSSAEVAQQTATNKVLFGAEVATLFLDMAPIAGKGVSAGFRLGKAGLRAIRLNSRIIPSLVSRPGRAGALYSDFTVAASGLPVIRRAPLRPVPKPPLAPSATLAGSSAVRPVAIPARDLNAYAAPQDTLKNVPLRPDGTYQVGDQWYVRFTDSTGVNRPFEISSVFKARNGQVSIVEPGTSRRVAHLQSAGNGEWRLASLPAGRRHKGRVAPPANATYMDRILSGAAAHDIDGNAATTGHIRRWFRRDMDNFYNDLATNGMPTRPPLPAMNVNSTPESAIQNTLSQPQVRGLVIGEVHDEPAAFQLVIDQMQNFKKSGVTTIYLEGAPFLQGSPNPADAALLPSDAPYLSPHPYQSSYTSGPTIVDIINEAKKHGIKVIGLEHQQLTWRTDSPRGRFNNVRWVEDRLKEFNYHSAKIIEQTPPNEKFVAVVGKNHMNTYEYIPGIAELTGGAGVSVSPSAKGGSSIVSQPPHTPPPSLKYARGTSIPEPHGDIHIDYNIDALTA